MGTGQPDAAARITRLTRTDVGVDTDAVRIRLGRDLLDLRRHWTRVTVACLAALAAASLAGCRDDGSELPSDRLSAQGPLSIGDSGGLMALSRRAHEGRSSAVFGGLLICTMGEPATIRRIEYETMIGTAEIGGAIRMIPPASGRADPNSIRWAPISAVRGDLRSDRLRRKLKGSIIDDVEGVVIDQQCGPRQPGEALTELLTTVEAGNAGAWVTSQEVIYEADGREYSLAVPWVLLVCGSLTADPNCDDLKSGDAR